MMIVGLPLASGLNTRQLAAVISHELGHCTQAFAMRLGYIIGGINGWFYRVVYQRDAWDVAIQEWQDTEEDWRISIVVLLISLAVWASRTVLKLLLIIGHIVSCFLLRQMEYHADRCAMEVSGSEGIESLLIRLREQGVIHQKAFGNLAQMWKKKRQLPDCLPEFLDQFEQRLPAGFHENAQLTLLNETCSWFATHPTANQRIKHARRLAIPGIFTLEKPARALFNDFNKLEPVPKVRRALRRLGGRAT